MRTELYSVRSSTEEIDYINRNLKSIVTQLNTAIGIKVLYKTEIDQSAKKIKTELISNLNTPNPPELHIFVNALDTEDISSFYELFSPFIEALEKEIRKSEDATDIHPDSYPHIQIHPIEGLPGRYPAYCFTFKRRKYLALPRISLTGADFTAYLVKATAKAKDIFYSAFESCPDGYIYSQQKPASPKDKFFSIFSKAKEDSLHFDLAPDPQVGTREGIAPTDIDKDLEQTVIFDTDIKSEPAPVVITASAQPVEPVTPPTAAPAEKNISAAEKPHTLADEITMELLSRKASPTEDIQKEIPAPKEEAPSIEKETPAPKKDTSKEKSKDITKKAEEKSFDNIPDIFAPKKKPIKADIEDIPTPSADNTFEFVEELNEGINIKKPKKEKKKKERKQKETAQTEVPVTEEPLTAVLPQEDTDSQENTPPQEDNSSKKKSKFMAFLHSFIPMKGDSKKSIILKIVTLLGIITFLVGAFLLLKFYVIDPSVNKADMAEIQGIFYSSPEDETVIEEIVDENGVVSTVVTTKSPTRNWKAVKKVNDEIVGWIKLDGTKIDYPVLFHKEDNEDSLFYLYKNYKKEYSDFGSIFVDYRCPEGGESKHVVLHGHNMGSDKDSMFGSLVKYTIKDGRTQANPEYYKKHAIINYDTPEANGEWVVFAVMKIDVSNSNKNIFNYLLSDFENNAQFLNFIYNIKERSYFDVNIPINENDRILTLSTCSYETDNMRTIVVARKVRDGEDVSSYVKSAKGKTPTSIVLTDFVSEYDNIKWYDGEGKPTGNGMLEFIPQSKMYTVKFYDAYGKVIRTEKVLEGKDAVGIVGAPPVKESDDTYHYRFLRWDKSYKKVTKNLEIRPVYEKTLISPPTTAPQDNPVVTPEPTQTPTQAPTTQAPTQTPTQASTQAPVTTQAPEPVPTQTVAAEPTPSETSAE